ncbi:glycoside hydrolase domain-containing protein [Virgibacillus ainsalahensis]
MNRYEKIGLIVLLAGTFVLLVFMSTNLLDSPDSGENNEEQEENESGNDNKDLYWGVDSASYTDENLFACVVDNFGEPEVWGRYLGDREGVSAGMDAEEIDYLHENGVQVLIIYNHVNDATGYDHGVNHANEAIAMAEEIEIPEGVAIFGDIEPSYPIDSAFIEGWYETLKGSAYEPALYGVFNEESDLMEAYHATGEEVQENTIVWTAYPQEEITTKKNAPEFNPQGPDSAMLYGWQYAIDAETCNIDTNLFTDDMIEYLW